MYINLHLFRPEKGRRRILDLVVGELFSERDLLLIFMHAI
jgi:hypothetical protein